MDNNKEACRSCYISNTCHPRLRPTHFDGSRSAWKADSCIHWACNTGLKAGRQTLTGTSTGWQVFVVTELDNSRHSTDAAPFGAGEKTDNWITSREGTIYSRQDGNYYATGQRILK